MSPQDRVRVDHQRTRQHHEEAPPVAAKTPESTKAETEALLDDIDKALGESAATTAEAQKFVDGYQQKGGE